MTLERDLSDELTTLIRSTRGVTAIYAPVFSIPGSIGNLGASNGRPPGVVVTTTADRISVSISIGVERDLAAQTTCRHVYDTVANYLTSHVALTPTEIRVTVASIS